MMNIYWISKKFYNWRNNHSIVIWKEWLQINWRLLISEHRWLLSNNRKLNVKTRYQGESIDWTNFSLIKRTGIGNFKHFKFNCAFFTRIIWFANHWWEQLLPEDYSVWNYLFLSIRNSLSITVIWQFFPLVVQYPIFDNQFSQSFIQKKSEMRLSSFLSAILCVVHG